MQPEYNLENLTIFIYTKTKKAKIDNDSKDFLKKELFGEKILLKRIQDIKFILTDTLNPGLLTLSEVRTKFKWRNASTVAFRSNFPTPVYDIFDMAVNK